MPRPGCATDFSPDDAKGGGWEQLVTASLPHEVPIKGLQGTREPQNIVENKQEYKNPGRYIILLCFCFLGFPIRVPVAKAWALLEGSTLGWTPTH